MLEGNGQVANGRAGIGLSHEVHLVTLHGLHKALGHSIALRAGHGRVDWLQAHITRETAQSATSMSLEILGFRYRSHSLVSSTTLNFFQLGLKSQKTDLYTESMVKSDCCFASDRRDAN